jgi:hypothetical protein
MSLSVEDEFRLTKSVYPIDMLYMWVYDVCVNAKRRTGKRWHLVMLDYTIVSLHFWAS